ncbi:hypothetical protein SO802_015054 [Lithocarpus litseifolius]|uniref:Uncharacterized protein n=1 Tax=Lithocarpus litseifolius TaxID=425828 RepID=A0AAW2CUR6_9ROSI
MDFASYGNNNVVEMIRRMNYLPGMNLLKTVKNATTQVLIIPTATPPFGLGYKPTNDDLLEMERYDPKSRIMMPGFELFFDCNNKVLELKKEDTNCVPTDWADYMDPDAMTPLLGDAICNIEEEDDEEEEGGEAPNDDDEGSNSKSDSSSDSSISDNENSEDDCNSDNESSSSEDYDNQYSGNDWGAPPSDRDEED